MNKSDIFFTNGEDLIEFIKEMQTKESEDEIVE